ncbi:MAG: hypothetical protein KC931_14245, partial [Candidatus Omnitrophica bacterium]|nr:hypothetical protein [Candidatus Omnitrophota bacterium]
TVTPTPSPVPVPASPPEPLEAALDNLALTFLKDISDHPDSGVANRYKRLGISVRQGQKLKARMVAEGLIEDRLETTEKGTKRVVRPTRLADQAVGVEPEA